MFALWPDAHLLAIDLQVYRAGGEHVLRGEPLYAGGVLLDLPFVYPPFSAVLFAPLSLLPLGLLKFAWTAAGVGLLGYVIHRCAPFGLLTVLALTIVATGLDPVRTTLYLGQVNLVLLALVATDLLGRPECRWRGVGIGVAAAVKLTPLLFVGYLLVTGRRRAAATASGVFVAAAGLGFLLAPADSVEYWLRGTFAAADRISDVAGVSNHSLNGLLARLGAPLPVTWLVCTVVLGAVTLVVAARAHRVGEEVLALSVCGLASAALAPFAWSHHWVWVVPPMVLLAHRAAAGSRRAAMLLGGLLVVTLAMITALPGPAVGPIPSTGLISLQPDAHLLLYAGALWLAWGTARRYRSPTLATCSASSGGSVTTKSSPSIPM